MILSVFQMRIGRYDVAVTNLDKVFFPASGLTKRDGSTATSSTEAGSDRKVSLASRFERLGLEAPAP